MIMPRHPRIGFWGNFAFQRPFGPMGFWSGDQLPDFIVGTRMTQELDEGTLHFHVNVLFDRQKPRREQLETVLVFDKNTPEVLLAMWNYETWERKEYDDDPRRECEDRGGSPAPSRQGELPW